ncbi:Flp family type IVb pilin [Phytohabitans aurantiacus]|jgi:Flp pilus assembly pilin Flp|uniref:Pilus assembly protein n=1 Tax=Phytohabitans aurantiacus TaxID=3016789 RepID=A0ABQ5QLS4_9ACTN|nr:hypothetical protein [Phytohabitans aurantiacus]GLH95195.1 hypothetical protein Pa4123_04670 [Phytohabitans aurantiacus]
MLKLVVSTRNRMKALLASKDRGVTAAEYALIVAVVIAAISGLVLAFANAIGANFTEVTGKL